VSAWMIAITQPKEVVVSSLKRSPGFLQLYSSRFRPHTQLQRPPWPPM